MSDPMKVTIKIEADYSKLPNAKKIASQFRQVKLVKETPRTLFFYGLESAVIMMIFDLKRYGLQNKVPIHCVFVDDILDNPSEKGDENKK